MESIIIDHDRCIHCGMCSNVCVRKFIDDSEDILKLRDMECISCGHCKAACPEDAIEIPDLYAEEFIPFSRVPDFTSPEKLLTFFRARRSTRIYKETPVEKDTIEQIIEAGRFAPTGGNRQPLRYVASNSLEKIDEIRTLTFDSLLKQVDQMVNPTKSKSNTDAAPSVVYRTMLDYAELIKDMARACDKGVDRLLWHAPALIAIHASKEVESPEIEAGLCAMQMVLMAEALGLGTCFIGFINMASDNSPELKKVMQIPDHHRVITAFVAGYPDVNYYRLVSRKPAQVRWM